MATLTVTIPNAVVQRVRNAFAARFDYRATLPDGSANPETIDAFTQRMTREWMKSQVIWFERRAAEITAGNTAETTANTDIALT